MSFYIERLIKFCEEGEIVAEYWKVYSLPSTERISHLRPLIDENNLLIKLRAQDRALQSFFHALLVKVETVIGK
jgi:hypothetical protein